MLAFTVRGSKPTPLVALACGSASTSRVRRSSTPRLAARLMAVVVLPTPPFWFTMEMILAMLYAPWPGAGVLTKVLDACSADRAKRWVNGS